MTSLNHDLFFAISLLAHALPDSARWSGTAANTCADQIERLIHELRVCS